MYIFYIDENIKNTYTFFDKNKNEIDPKIGTEFDSYIKDTENSSSKKYYVFADIDLDHINRRYFWSYNHICKQGETEAIGELIGDGISNYDIICQKYQNYLTQNGSMWQLCNQLNLEIYLGNNNWHIPSKQELGAIISVIQDKKLQLNNIKIDQYDYWTSTQRNSAVYAWYYDHEEHKFFASSKEKRYKIIPIAII